MGEYYDGWVIKNVASGHLLQWSYRELRRDVVKTWSHDKKNWIKTQREGKFKIVKVKLVEVK